MWFYHPGGVFHFPIIVIGWISYALFQSFFNVHCYFRQCDDIECERVEWIDIAHGGGPQATAKCARRVRSINFVILLFANRHISLQQYAWPAVSFLHFTLHVWPLADCGADIQPSNELLEQLHNIVVSAAISYDHGRNEINNQDTLTSEDSSASKLLTTAVENPVLNVCYLSLQHNYPCMCAIPGSWNESDFDI